MRAACMPQIICANMTESSLLQRRVRAPASGQWHPPHASVRGRRNNEAGDAEVRELVQVLKALPAFRKLHLA